MNILSNDSSSSAIYVVISSLVGIILTGVSLNFLGSELYGLWVLILTILILGMFGENGLGLPIIRLINLDNAKKNQEVITTCIIPIALVIFLINVALILVNQPFINYINNSGFDIAHKELVLPLMGIVVSIFLLSIIPSSFLIGYKKLHLVNYIKALSRILQLLIALLLFKYSFNLWSVILALLVYQLSVLFFSVVLTLKIFKFKICYQQFFNKSLFQELARVGYKIIIGRIVGLAGDPLFKYSLGAFLGLKYVAFFDVAFKINSIITQVPLVALKGRMPVFTKLIDGKLESNVAKVMRKIDLQIVFYVIPMFLFTFLFSEYFMKLWLLMEYDYRMRHALLFLMPTLSMYIFANARELFLISKGDSLTTLGAYSINAFTLVFILIVIYVFLPKANFYVFMSAYCFAHLCGSLFIYQRYNHLNLYEKK